CPELVCYFARRVGQRHEMLNDRLRIRINAVFRDPVILEILASGRIFYCSAEEPVALRLRRVLASQKAHPTLPAPLFREKEESPFVASAVEFRYPYRSTNIVTEIVVSKWSFVHTFRIVFRTCLREAPVVTKTSQRRCLKWISSLQDVIPQKFI